MEQASPGPYPAQPSACDDIGHEIYALAEKIFPICRSITGNGVRKTLDILAEHIELERHEVPSGTQVFDWTVPREWNIRAASIRDMQGRTIVDFADSNLHVLNYSAPFKGILPLSELRKHIHTLPEQPQAIPYRTSYYAEDWGFCMAHERLEEMPDAEYRVEIDSELKQGSLTYGECVLPGETDREVLLSAHI